MSPEPNFLETKNAIVSGTGHGQKISSAWHHTTADQRLPGLPGFLAISEESHAAMFTKHISKLGFNIQERSSDRFVQRLELARSAATGDAGLQNFSARLDRLTKTLATTHSLRRS